MADEVEAVGAEDVGEVEDVGDEAVDAVRLDLGRTHTRRVAALVRRDGVEPGGAERRHAVAPRVAGLREAVQQEHERAVGRPGVVGDERARPMS